MAKLVNKKTSDVSNLYGYILWCNTLETNGPIWYAIPRDQEMLFFNGNRKMATGVVSNKNVNTLITEIKQLK